MPLEHRPQIKLPVVKVGSRMARIDRHRGQNRECPLVEELIELVPFLAAQFVVAQDAQAFGGQLRPDQFVPTAILGRHQLLGSPGDPLQLRDRAQAVGRIILRRAVAERLFAQARHPDHEKLVQVRAEDRQKLDALEQRIAGVLGLFENTLVEIQPTQFAVDEMFGPESLLHHRSPISVSDESTWRSTHRAVPHLGRPPPPS